MGRTQLSPQHRFNIKKANIGRIIIFCEGKTEKYYFDYFSEILKKNKYTGVEVILETANGNAQTVLNLADRFLLLTVMTLRTSSLLFCHPKNMNC